MIQLQHKLRITRLPERLSQAAGFLTKLNVVQLLVIFSIFLDRYFEVSK